MTAHATEPASIGYLLTVACPCEVVFERWGHAWGCRGGPAAPCWPEL